MEMDMTKIKVEGLDMAYDETTMEEAAKRVAEQFGVLVEITDRHPVVGGGGWPTISIIGTVQQVMLALTSPGGWSDGDPESTMDMAWQYLKEAKEIFG